MDGNFPIDIQLKKMTDWMVSRRLCNKNWHSDISVVREKTALAIQDMPEHPTIKDILSATNVNYYNCKSVLEVLMETEKDSKNVFGMYTSTRMADWRKVISLYEKDSCYLPEASNYLCQAVLYEIPSLRKQIAKQEKQLNELDKLEAATEKKITEMISARASDCRKIGIKGDLPKKEILDIVNELPTLYDQWLEKAKPKLEPLMKKYRYAASAHRHANSCLPALSFLLEKGNVTAYEYIHGEAPLSIEEPTLLTLETEDEAVNEEICLDLDVDVDLSVDNAVDLETAEIAWGDLEVTEDAGGADTIDWGSVDDGLSAHIVIEESGTTGGVAMGNEAMCILDNQRLRNLVLDELDELSMFCKLRSLELSQEKGFVLSDALSNSGDDSSSVWQEQHFNVNNLVDNLNGPGQLHLLHQVKTSSTFVNRLVSEMQHKLDLASRLRSKIEDIKAKRIASTEEAANLQKSSKRVLEKTKWLQGQLEADISKRYNGRKVNILGGVQSLM